MYRRLSKVLNTYELSEFHEYNFKGFFVTFDESDKHKRDYTIELTPKNGVIHSLPTLFNKVDEVERNAACFMTLIPEPCLRFV